MFKNKKIKIASIALLLALGLGLAFFIFATRDRSNTNSDSINYGPPTSVELEETSRHKDELANDDEDASSEQQSKEMVTPFVTYWGQQSAAANFEANAYIPEVVDEGGTCSLSLSRGDDTVESKKTALPDAQSTSCGLMVIEPSALASGEWEMVVHYESGKYEGSSEPITVTVK